MLFLFCTFQLTPHALESNFEQLITFSAKVNSFFLQSFDNFQQQSMIHFFLHLNLFILANIQGCGISLAKQTAQRRIVGGDDAGFGSFPWQAYIRIGSSR